MADTWVGPLLANGSPWVLLGAVVFFLVRSLVSGTLITRREHDNRVGDLKEALTAKDKTIDAQRDTIAEREKQVSILLGARPREDH